MAAESALRQSGKKGEQGLTESEAIFEPALNPDWVPGGLELDGVQNSIGILRVFPEPVGAAIRV